MKELTLTEIKHIEFDILKYFREVCHNYGLQYFLSNGTLLGAIKYGGFIPWDDDIDVIMPRTDYNRLIHLFQDTEEYVLFSIERQPKFMFPFAKLCDMKTYKDETGINNGITLGVDIDIFPLDEWTDSLEQCKCTIQRIQTYYRKICLSKIPLKGGKNFIRTCIKMIVLLVVKCNGSKRYVKRIQKIVIKKNSKNARYKGCFVWPIYGENEIIPAEFFSDTVEVEFEGETFSAPVGYDAYLRSLYGDYEKEPPTEKQRTHHNFTAYRV